ncbi:MAG: hypothetical protein JNM41_16020 [Flavipsychrobacter sp.]|nr:hypothetical protein [Flavipsychrobacter sp.]
MLARILLFTALSMVPCALVAQRATKSTQNPPLSKVDHKQPGTPMPSFIFMAYQDTAAGATTVSGRKNRKKKKFQAPEDPRYSLMTDKDLESDGNLFVMLFNPTCSHCEDMTMIFEKNAEAFKSSKLLLLAAKPMTPYIPDFAERHNIAKYKSMYIGWDSSGLVEDMFLYQQLPQINIFDNERKLIKIFSGEVPADTIRKFIN